VGKGGGGVNWCLCPYLTSEGGIVASSSEVSHIALPIICPHAAIRRNWKTHSAKRSLFRVFCDSVLRDTGVK